MKDKISIIIFISACIAAFFYLREGEKEEVPYLLSYELTWRGDTINKVDLRGLKQGKWHIYQYSNHEDKEGQNWLGYFKDGKKEGYWTKLSCEEQDSVQYIGCRVHIDPNKTYTFTVKRDILFADTTKVRSSI